MKILIPVSVLTIVLSFFAFSQYNEKEAIVIYQKIKVQSEIDNAIVIEGKISQAILKTSNGCGIGNFLIPVAGDSSQGLPPMIGALSANWPTDFKVLDTIPGTKIKSVAFRRETWPENTSIISSGNGLSPYVVISDSGMFSYSIPGDFNPWTNELTMLDSITIPGINKVAKQITTDKTDPIVLYIKDSTDNRSLQFYSYPELQEQFSFPFYFEPEIFEVTEDGLFITGLDTSGSYMLYHFSTNQDILYATYTLNDLVSNAQEFLKTGDSAFVLSSPGDSIIMLTKINLTDSTLFQTVIYSKSGARATHNEFKNNKYFTFQPTSDFPDALLDKQILILNPITNQMDTLMVNLQLDYFKFPNVANQGFGYFELQWVGAKWDGSSSDTAYIKQSSDIIKVKAEAFPQYLNATYGCWVSVNENELEKIKFEFYPNPASSEVTINLSGLKKGKQYKLDVIDNSGRVHYTTYLKAYQKIQLPLDKFAKGIYFMKLDTGRNLITKKLIIQ